MNDGLSQIIGDREDLVKALEALQGSVETLKAEKAVMRKELNILKGNDKESIKSDGYSLNEQMEILEKDEKDAFVDPEKVDVQIETPTMSTENMESGGKIGSTKTKKYLIETENDALVHSEQADMQIELETVRMTKDNSTENSSLVGSADTSVGDIQLDLESSKAEQVDPFEDEGDKDNMMEGLVTKETNYEFATRNETRNASETEQSPLLDTLKAENATLVQAVKTLRREKADMHQFHSQVERDRVNFNCDAI